MGYGLSPYGTSPYGGSPFTLSVAAAWAITTHAIRVQLTAEPFHVDTFDAGDALNPLNWSIVDTTAGRDLTVAIIGMHDATTVDIQTLEPLGDHLESHTVTASNLISVDGFPMTAPVSATFPGVVQTLDPVEQSRAVDFRDRDFANPPFQITRGLGAAGTLVIGPDGDFENESGRPLLRKLLLRRMNTKRGSIRHLPEYGVEFEEKEPIASGGDLVAVLRDVEAQAQQEPDVIKAVARGSLDRSGVLVIQLSVQAQGGVTINLRMGAAHGRLVEM